MAEPVVDEIIFGQLLDMDDNSPPFEFTNEILQSFFEQMQEGITEFRELLQKEDYAAIGDLGHKLKGSSGQVGANRLRAICDDIQHWKLRASGNPKSYLENAINKLPSLTDEVKRELYSRIGK